MHILRVLTAVLCTAVCLVAVDTRNWETAEMADFEKGTLTKLSLGSEGRLMLAPMVKEILDPSVTFLWAVARDSKGNVYAGGGGLGGSKAKLLAVDPSGKAKTFAELDGMAIQAIAIDRQDRVYAATSPDGKIYRVDPAGKAEVFYDPKAKYIWAMAFSSRGDLYVATGDRGEIHRVTPAGAGSVFFQTEESHARSLAIDANDNLIVGTDPSGLVLRLATVGDQAGQGFVLFQAPKREITALAVAKDGTIYAAGVGNQAPVILPAVPPAPIPPPPAPSGQGGLTVTVNARPAPAPPPTLSTTATAIAGGSEIYRIAPDGFPRRIWGQPQDLVYALAFDAHGKLIAGTGNRGFVYRLDSDHVYTRLLNVAPTQVTGLITASDGQIFAVTGNIGEIFSIGPGFESSGTFESDIHDAGTFSYWGRLSHESEGQGGSVVFETRSGNLSRAQKNWSPWAKLAGDRITSPAARFLEYRATLSGPFELTEVNTAFQMKNVPPVIEALEITPANYKFPAPSTTPAVLNPTLTLPALGRPAPSAAAAATDSGNSPALTYSKGQIGARWLANDLNGDTLVFKVEIRGEKETGWKLLKDNLRDRYYSWDSTAFPDGKYVLRVTASDSPSNPPDAALTASFEGDPFVIDNTPPEITGLTGTKVYEVTPAAGSSLAKIEVRFHAEDALNVIDKAEYSVNGGDWLMVEPTTRISDSQKHDYRVLIDRGAGETTVAVRVGDAYDNQAVAKTVVR